MTFIPVLGVPGASSSPDAALACESPVHVPGQGPSCRAPDGGWLVLLDDGTVLPTHGPDPPPSQSGGVSPFATPSDPTCVASGQPGTMAVYAVPSDKSSRYATVLPTIREAVRTMNGRLVEAGVESGGVGTRYRFVCDLGQVVVANEQLATSSGSDSFATISSNLRDRGYTNANTKYLVFYDDGVSGYCGQGTLYSDSRLLAENYNNLGGVFGIVYDAFGGCNAAAAAMHEHGHTVGAVQGNAPYTSGAGHCSDGDDVMCYRDGGPYQCTTGGGDCVNRCFDFEHFDCGHDTYFHSDPFPGSYLSNNWNVGSTLNRFIDFGTAACAPTGVVTIYRDANFLRGCLSLSAPDTDLANNYFDTGDWANDGASSMIIAPGATVYVYEHANFGGAVYAFSGVVPYVGNAINDRISSIWFDSCSPGSPAIVYEHSNFGGGCRAFDVGPDNWLGDNTFTSGTTINNAISSVRIGSGHILTLYGEDPFKGATRDAMGSVAYVGDYWNDQASSLRVTTVDEPCFINAVVILYEDVDFKGGCKAIEADHDWGLDDNLFNNGNPVANRVSSLRVKPGFTLRLYDGWGYTGASSEFLADTPSLVLSGWNDRAESVFRFCKLPLTEGQCGLIPGPRP